MYVRTLGSSAVSSGLGSTIVGSGFCDGVGVVRRAEGGDCRSPAFVPVGSFLSCSPGEEPLANASKPSGACITELGCSSSSDLGLSASSAACFVSSCRLALSPFGDLSDSLRAGPSCAFGDWASDEGGGCGVASASSCNASVSSIVVVSVLLDEVEIGEGSAMSLGLVARGDE